MTISVRPAAGGWGIFVDDKPEPREVHETQNRAVRTALELAARLGMTPPKVFLCHR